MSTHRIEATEFDLERAHLNGQAQHSYVQEIANIGGGFPFKGRPPQPNRELEWAWDLGWRLAEHLRPHVQGGRA